MEDTNLYIIREIDVGFEKKTIKEKINLEIVLELIKEFDETTLSLRSKNALRNIGCYYVGDIFFFKKRRII